MLKRYVKFFRIEYLFFIILFIFSWALFWKTFRLGDGTMELATKLWSDFGAAIPLERSFAYGSNFPPQYPIFAGPPIRYHFVFFMTVGMLEWIGVPIDWALNSISILGFFGLLLFIYILGVRVFKSKFVGAISVILFLFNGSLGFLEYFKRHTLDISIFKTILSGTEWTSFGPYDGKAVSAFWSLNIFTNQRHLALGYAAYLALLLFLYVKNQSSTSHKSKIQMTNVKSIFRKLGILGKPENQKHQRFREPDIRSSEPLELRLSGSQSILSFPKAIFIGVVVGLFPFIHLTVYLMMCITLLLAFLIFPHIRKQILLMGLVAGSVGIPQILAMGQSMREVKLFHPGYLVEVEKLTIQNFLSYWFLNLGLTSILSVIGFILANKEQRKLFIPFIVFFIIGNLFQFSPEMASNHKFFNLFVIGANMFTAYALYRLWKLHWSFKLLIPFLLIPLTLTGIIDLFPIFNDRYMVIDDISKNPTAQFILKNTPPDAVFLNATFLYDTASLAGRKIYLGWPYFSWSAGYDTDTRFKTMKQILASTDKQTVCATLQTENLDYIEIQEPTTIEEAKPNYAFFNQNFKTTYYDPKANIRIYDVKKSCL